MFRPRKRIKLEELLKSEQSPNQAKPNKENLSTDLSTNDRNLREIFKNCADIVFRTINIGGKERILIVYIDGMCDTKTLENILLKPLLFEGLPNGLSEVGSIGQVMEQELVALTSVKKVNDIQKIVNGILLANIAIFVEGEASALLADLKSFEKRGVEEPTTEVSIRGPRDGFTESLRTNTTLIRRRIRSEKLKIESFSIGELTKTDVAIVYIEGIAPETLLKEVRSRISRIKVDVALGSEVIEEFIEDEPYSPFPQIQNTERPDIAVANLAEGKVLILVDNTPFNLIVPMTFWSGLQSVEDYYERFIYATFIRIIRFTLFNISLFLPSLYVALTTFHPKLIPTTLLISIAAARENVPFPALIEAFLMEFVFEGLREAGIRLPKAVGSAVSIVGALVIGQAAVQAGIVSAPMVIIVAATGIASFAIPRYNLGIATRMIRFVMLFLAGALGLYGIVIGFIALTIHLVNLRSFGVPYFSPVAPQIPKDLKDFVIRSPRWLQKNRPAYTGRNKKRIPEGQKPDPSQ
ncbi:spore germination protein [Schinkia sp. CFF1]